MLYVEKLHLEETWGNKDLVPQRILRMDKTCKQQRIFKENGNEKNQEKKEPERDSWYISDI